MIYLIEKSGKLHSQILIKDVAFNSDLFEIIETDIELIFLVNKWNGTAWEEAATPEEIAEFNKVSVPADVHAIAFMSALEMIGITEAMVDAFIETLPLPNSIIIRNSFKRAVRFHRNSPFIPMVGVAFQKSDEDLDNVFRTARQIEIQLNL